MSNLHLDLRVVSSVPDAYKANSVELMRFAGANIGNYAFRHALKSLVDLNQYKTIVYSNIPNELSNGQPETVLVSCANWLCATEQYEASNGNRAIMIDKLKCNVVSFGLGAQAPSEKTKLVLGPNTIRLARVLADKCHYLSVRDVFTAEILSSIGIKNTVITGCPSNFINLDPMLGTKIAEQAKLGEEIRDWTGVRTHISEFSGGHVLSGAILKSTLELLSRSSSFYVLQSPSLLPFLLREDDIIPSVYFRHFPVKPKSMREASAFLRSKLLHFSSIEAWMDFARTCDLAIGMRIHGNMVPLQAGVPSIVIGHDSRTNGLAQIMGIPSMQPEQFTNYVKTNAGAIYALIADQMQSYDSTRVQLAKTMNLYLSNNNVTPNSKLTTFIQ